MNISPCPNCGSKSQFKMNKKRLARTGNPAYIAWIMSYFQTTPYDSVICESCGLVRLFVGQEARQKLPTAKHWERV
ncbi:MAG TPA: hypothetical protein VM100_08480 [Longimicrobiales bacterium]|nr:hypothetical protein [Longimicrobiales bacterium]